MTPSGDESQGERSNVDPSAEAPSVEPKKRRRGLIVAGIVGGGLVIAAAVTLGVVALVQPSPIEQAGEACGGSKPLDTLLASLSATASPDPDEDQDSPGEEFVELFDGVVSVEDGGRTLIVNTKSEDEDVLGLTSLALDCVYEKLDVPTYVSERIGQTRALDGRQDADWDSFTASWGYHPDDGANVIIVQK